jgi:protein tyrosine phosphatase (PTP) superfamily phosphohydrolase (DUF442 family)
MSTTSLHVLAASLWIGAAACGPAPIAPSEVEGPFTWGGMSNVTHVRHLWFSGQPDQAALERAKTEGIGVVINLRDPSEHDWDERSAADALGITYYSVPVRREEPFDPAAFAKIEALVEQYEGQQVLVHCSSSDRAGGWFATHLVGEHGMTLEDALVVGRRTGITKDVVVKNVRDYVAAGAPR